MQLGCSDPQAADSRPRWDRDSTIVAVEHGDEVATCGGAHRGTVRSVDVRTASVCESVTLGVGRLRGTAVSEGTNDRVVDDERMRMVTQAQQLADATTGG